MWLLTVHRDVNMGPGGGAGACGRGRISGCVPSCLTVLCIGCRSLLSTSWACPGQPLCGAGTSRGRNTSCGTSASRGAGLAGPLLLLILLHSRSEELSGQCGDQVLHQVWWHWKHIVCCKSILNNWRTPLANLWLDLGNFWNVQEVSQWIGWENTISVREIFPQS